MIDSAKGGSLIFDWGWGLCRIDLASASWAGPAGYVVPDWSFRRRLNGGGEDNLRARDGERCF